MSVLRSLLFGLTIVTAPDPAVGFPVPPSGAWAGPLRLCRTNVESAELLSDSSDGRPTLTVKLNPAARLLWSKITEQSVGREIPMSLDGTVIARPVLQEGIEFGIFQVSGPDLGALARMAERVSEPC